MAAPFQKLGEQYQLLGRTISASLSRINSDRSRMSEEAVVLQGSYLFGVRAFEGFLESQLVLLCSPDTGWGPKVVGGRERRFVRKLSDPNSRRIKAALVTGRQYADYLPIEKTLEKATIMFAGGRPFSLLNADQREIIKRTHTVRNLMAHESDHSLRQFQRVACARYNLRPEHQTAVGYILHEQRKGVPMIRQDLEGLLGIAQFLD